MAADLTASVGQRVARSIAPDAGGAAALTAVRPQQPVLWILQLQTTIRA